MKILITGSHFTPAQATIEELQRNPNIKIVYLGRKYTREGDKSLSVESQILPKLGVKFIPIITGRLQRVFTAYTIPSLLKIPVGLFQSFYFLIKEQPDVVLSFGGYVAVPTVFSAWLLSIPVIIHEQTLVSGLANTISSYFADKIAVSFERKYGFNKTKTILTGNPLRKEIFNKANKYQSEEIRKVVNVAKQEKLPLILITGGNQGSHIINETVCEILDNLTNQAVVIHQTGDSKFSDLEKLQLKQKNLKNPQRYFADKWLGEDFGLILHEADLAVSRAGVNTLVELAYCGVPALLIPIPYLYKNEQVENARFFENLGLTKTLPQSQLTPKTLLEKINDMLKSLKTLKDQARNSRSIIISDAASRLALETMLLAKK